MKEQLYDRFRHKTEFIRPVLLPCIGITHHVDVLLL